MKNMKLAMKIGIGFGIIILLTMTVSLFAWQGLITLDQGVSDFRGIAHQTNLIGRIQANMLMAQVSVKAFLISGTEIDSKHYKGFLDKSKEFMATAGQSVKNPELAQRLTAVDEKIVNYDSTFGKIVAFKSELDLLVANLDKLGGAMEQTLTDLMDKAAKTGATSTGYTAGLSIRQLLLGRLHVSRFLDTSSAADAELVDTDLTELEPVLKDLKDALLRVEWQAMVVDINKNLAEYRTKFTLLVAKTNERNVLVSKSLDKLGPEISDAADSINLSYLEIQNELSPKLTAASSSALITMLVVSAIAIIFGITIGIFLTRTITGPIRKTAAFAENMANGDFTKKLDINQGDEIGVMAASLNTMVSQLGSMVKEIIAGVNTLTGSSTELTAISTQLNSAARETTAKSTAVAGAAEEMNSNIQSVSAAMEESASNVGIVATATEEMTATVNEIAKNAEKARSITAAAVNQSQQTSTKMASLGESAGKIGKVTETITEISEQTNLLALNATIEAARAGEAGKGFAVVANEIKELAKQTAIATVDIKNQIDEMQTTTTSTITDIEKISKIIEDIHEMINTIATAVEEQSAATNEIANNITQASQGIAEVNENVAQSTVVITDITREIAEINVQSTQVENSSDQVQSSATALSELSVQLKSLVNRFKVS
jgi:methyl-accepting chemotaxis protein